MNASGYDIHKKGKNVYEPMPVHLLACLITCTKQFMWLLFLSTLITIKGKRRLKINRKVHTTCLSIWGPTHVPLGWQPWMPSLHVGTYHIFFWAGQRETSFHSPVVLLKCLPLKLIHIFLAITYASLWTYRYHQLFWCAFCPLHRSI